MQLAELGDREKLVTRLELAALDVRNLRLEILG